jgi:hypothetical protein
MVTSSLSVTVSTQISSFRVKPQSCVSTAQQFPVGNGNVIVFFMWLEVISHFPSTGKSHVSYNVT